MVILILGGVWHVEIIIKIVHSSFSGQSVLLETSVHCRVHLSVLRWSDQCLWLVTLPIIIGLVCSLWPWNRCPSNLFRHHRIVFSLSLFCYFLLHLRCNGISIYHINLQSQRCLCYLFPNLPFLDVDNVDVFRGFRLCW